MTNEQIRIAVAELCGWKYIELRTVKSGDETIFVPFGTAPNGSANYLPNYPESLDACRDFEVMEPYWNRAYVTNLQIVTDYNPDNGTMEKREAFALCTTTARQRCEAFLRMKDKWVE